MTPKIKYIDYRPRGAARELMFRRDDEVVMSGPAGTGKSRGLLEKVNWIAEKYPESRTLLIRKTRTSLQTTTLVTYEQLVLPDGHAKVTYQGAEYPNGSVIVFGGMDKSSRIMSSEYDIVAVPEATELTEGEWEDLTTRLRWGHVPYQQMLGDCNPGPPGHWLKRRANNKRTVMLESRHEDNPILFSTYADWWAGLSAAERARPDNQAVKPWDGVSMTPKGAAYLGKLDKLTGARKQRLRHGLWVAAEGMVYEGWDPAIHLVDRFDVPASWPRIWAVDFGYTNPFVWQVWAIDPDGRMYRILEIYKTQTLVEDHAVTIRKVCAQFNEPIPVAVICDHDAEDRATLERHLGHIVGTTRPAFKSIRPGIEAVQSRMKLAGDKRPRMVFLRDSLVERDAALDEAKLPCSTEEEIESYVWPQTATVKDANKKDVPVKKDDHGCDAMRYVVAAVDGIDFDPSEQLNVVPVTEWESISPVY